MKKILLGKKIVVADVPVSVLGNKEVLVETAYSFVSMGTELTGVKNASKGIIGKIKSNPERVTKVLEMIRVNGVKKTLWKIKNKLESRASIGYSCSGRIIAIGSDVKNFSVGDLVSCGGQGFASHAEVVAVPINLVCKIPPNCDLRSASSATVCSIALQGCRRADLKLGETAVVLGLGLLGQITLQLLRESGVNTIGLDLNESRVQDAQRAGFENCFALQGSQAVSEVLVRTASMGADAVIISAATSSEGICQSAMEMCRKKGRVVVLGAVPLQFERDPFYRKEIDFMISCSYGPGRYDSLYELQSQDYPYAYVRWTENRNMEAILELIAKDKLNINCLIAKEFNIGDAEKAFQELVANEEEKPLAIVFKYDIDFGGQISKEKFNTSVIVKNSPVSKNKIGVGIIGAGQFCRNNHLMHMAMLKDKYQLLTICDKNPATAQDVSRQYGVIEASSEIADVFGNDNIDLVVITTRHDTHAEFAKKALIAGKNVLVEKPLALNQAELDEVSQVARQSDKYLMVGFNRRFSPHAVNLKKMLDRRISPLVINYRVLADPVPFDSWIYSSAGGGRVIGEACHMFDLFNYLVGGDIKQTEIGVIPTPAGTLCPAGDSFVTSIKYEDGSLCTLTYTTLGKKSKLNGKERIEAMWDHKSFVIDDFVESYYGDSKKLIKPSKGHYEELVALGEYLQGNASVPVSVSDSINATQISFWVDNECHPANM